MHLALTHFSWKKWWISTVGCKAVQRRSPDPDWAWQSEEPMAQCWCTLRCPPPVLWHDWDELLHGALRCVPCPRSPFITRMGQGSWPPHRETEVHEHRRPQEAGRCHCCSGSVGMLEILCLHSSQLCGGTKNRVHKSTSPCDQFLVHVFRHPLLLWIHWLRCKVLVWAHTRKHLSAVWK